MGFSLVPGNCEGLGFYPQRCAVPEISYTDAFERSLRGSTLFVTGTETMVQMSQRSCNAVTILSPDPEFRGLNAIAGPPDAYDEAVVVGVRGVILLFQAGGPILVNSPTGWTLNDVEFCGSYVAVGNSGTIIKSIDGGNSWSLLASPTQTDLFDLNCGTNDEIRIFGADLNGYISYDGGFTWTEMNFYGAFSSDARIRGSGPPDLYTSFFLDDSNGYVFGEFGVAFKTTDGGSTWQPGFVPGFNRINTAYFSSVDSGVVAGDNGTIRFTTDGALSWFEDSLASSLTTQNINHVEVNETDSIATIVGDSGTVIYVATDSTLLETHDVDTSIPPEYELSQNYPNPFNPGTTISFAISHRSLVTLKVYDLLGKEVAMLVNDRFSPGSYEATFDGSGLASGVYLYRLTSENFTATKKLVLVK
jgi:hypothetical protein